MDNEARRVRGAKYAEGVIDVARALSLIEKNGSNLVLSDKGYALHAVQQIDESMTSCTALLAQTVFETDGGRDAQPPRSYDTRFAVRIDRSQVDRTTYNVLWRFVLQWAESNIPSTAARDMVLQDLTESMSRLALAVNVDRKAMWVRPMFATEFKLDAKQRVQRFFGSHGKSQARLAEGSRLRRARDPNEIPRYGKGIPTAEFSAKRNVLFGPAGGIAIFPGSWSNFG